VLLTFFINPPAPHFVLAIIVTIWLSAVCPFWWIEARFCFLTATGTSMTINRPLISLIVKTRSISEIRTRPAELMRMPKQKGCTSCLNMLYKLFDNNILSWLFEKKELRTNN